MMSRTKEYFQVFILNRTDCQSSYPYLYYKYFLLSCVTRYETKMPKNKDLTLLLIENLLNILKLKGKFQNEPNQIGSL